MEAAAAQSGAKPPGAFGGILPPASTAIHPEAVTAHAIARTEVDPGVGPQHIDGHMDRDSPRRNRGLWWVFSAPAEQTPPAVGPSGPGPRDCRPAAAF